MGAGEAGGEHKRKEEQRGRVTCLHHTCAPALTVQQTPVGLHGAQRQPGDRVSTEEEEEERGCSGISCGMCENLSLVGIPSRLTSSSSSDRLRLCVTLHLLPCPRLPLLHVGDFLNCMTSSLGSSPLPPHHPPHPTFLSFFLTALLHYRYNFHRYLISMGDSDVPLSSSSLGSCHGV